MYMGKEDTIYLAVWHTEHLLSEIRTTVDDYPCRIRFKHYGCTETLVTRVCTATDITLASNDRHTSRCACAEECQPASIHPIAHVCPCGILGEVVITD